MKRGLFLASVLIGFAITSSVWANPQQQAGISGTVTDEETKNPIAGADVCIYLNPWTSPIICTNSDSSGYYEVEFGLRGLGGDVDTNYVYVACYKATYKGEWWDNKFSPQTADSIQVITGQVHNEIDFALGAGTASGITGKVVEQGSGIGINDATISVYALPDTITVLETTFTQSNGTYYVLLPSGSYLLHAEKQGYDEGTPQMVNVSTGEITDNINFTLGYSQGNGAISGVVMSEDSIQPLNDAYVELYTNLDNSPIAFQMTEQNGFYRFAPLSSGNYYIRVVKSGFISEWWDNKLFPYADSILVEGREVTDIDFYLAKDEPTEEGKVAGWVKDVITMNPIEGAYVKIVGSNDLGTYTDYQGRYLIKKVPAGMHQATASAAGFSPSLSDTFEVIANECTEDINFLLNPDSTGLPAHIHGIVLSEANGQPLPNAFVSALYIGSSQIVTTVKTQRNGTYAMTVSAGEYNIRANAYGFDEEYFYENSNDTIEVFPGQEIYNINFTLSASDRGGISGTILDTAGIGIPNAQVHAQGISNWFRGNAQTDSTGAYFIDGLLPGFYKVRAVATGYKRGAYPQPVEVLTDSTTKLIDIVLEELSSQSGTISGIVTDDSTSLPIPHTLIMVFSRKLPFVGYAVTNQNGFYVVKDVPVTTDSSFYVIALSREYIPEFYNGVYFWKEATLIPSPDDNIDFELGRFVSGFKGICGRITQGKASVDNAIIYAMDGEDIVGAAYSMDDGSYLIDQLPPGTYNLKISKPGYDDIIYGPISVVDQNISGVDIEIKTTGVSEDNTTSKKQALQLSVTPSIAKNNTTIYYTLPEKSNVELSVYNVSGRKVVTLTKGRINSGNHHAILNTQELTQGIYFVRLSGGKTQLTKKLIILQ